MGRCSCKQWVHPGYVAGEGRERRGKGEWVGGWMDGQIEGQLGGHLDGWVERRKSKGPVSVLCHHHCFSTGCQQVPPGVSLTSGNYLRGQTGTSSLTQPEPFMGHFDNPGFTAPYIYRALHSTPQTPRAFLPQLPFQQMKK